VLAIDGCIGLPEWGKICCEVMPQRLLQWKMGCGREQNIVDVLGITLKGSEWSRHLWTSMDIPSIAIRGIF